MRSRPVERIRMRWAFLRMLRVSLLLHRMRSSSLLELLQILIHRTRSARLNRTLRSLLHFLRMRSVRLESALLVLQWFLPIQTRSLVTEQKSLLPLQTRFLPSLPPRSRIQRILHPHCLTEQHSRTLQILHSSEQLVQKRMIRRLMLAST